MSDRFSLSFLCLLLAFFATMPASAQKTPPVPKPDTAPSSQEDQEPQPEPPKSVLNVEVKNDLLSVELENVDFGTAIKAVAEKAGFKIEGTGEVFSRKLNTRFTDIEVERGVLRLLTLVKESNYMLHYDTKGLISKLEIFGIGSGKAPSITTRQPLRPAPALRQPAVSPDPPQTQRPATVSPMPQTRPMPPVVRRRPVPSRPIPPSQPAAQSPISATPQAAEVGGEEEESVDEIPYVAPQPRLAPSPVNKP
jgi:hypothetical protein